MVSNFPWFPSVEALKVDLDLQFGQVGKLDRERRGIVHRPRNNGIPTFFCTSYEEVDGKYRLTGECVVIEFPSLMTTG